MLVVYVSAAIVIMSIFFAVVEMNKDKKKIQFMIDGILKTMAPIRKDIGKINQETSQLSKVQQSFKDDLEHKKTLVNQTIATFKEIPASYKKLW